ncbi:glycosyltransferase, partial [Xanthomonas perforans]|nr:glycosyltransferase [Xanthomonas perforans]
MMQGQRVDVETTGIASGTTPPGVVIPLGGFPVLSTTQEAFALDLFHALAARQPRR